MSKLFINQTAAAKVHGGLFDAFYLHHLQSLLAQKPHEQDNQQVHGGGNIHRVKLAPGNAGLKTAGQVIFETPRCMVSMLRQHTPSGSLSRAGQALAAR